MTYWDDSTDILAAHGTVITVAVTGKPLGVWLEMKGPNMLANILLTQDQAEELVDALSRAATHPNLGRSEKA